MDLTQLAFKVQQAIVDTIAASGHEAEYALVLIGPGPDGFVKFLERGNAHIHPSELWQMLADMHAKNPPLITSERPQ